MCIRDRPRSAATVLAHSVAFGRPEEDPRESNRNVAGKMSIYSNQARANIPVFRNNFENIYQGLLIYCFICVMLKITSICTVYT